MSCYKSDFKLKLNRQGSVFTLYAGDMECTVDMSVLSEGSSTLIICNPSRGLMFPLYNFRSLCEINHCTAREFPRIFKVYGLMQIDKQSEDSIITKVFLPKGQYTLDSDTDDYSEFMYLNIEELHKTDIDTSYDISDVQIKKSGDFINVTLNADISKYYKRLLYLNYAGMATPIKNGKGIYRFLYVKGNHFLYTGEPYSSYEGRKIEIPATIREEFHDK